MLDYALRPLFNYMRAVVVPTGIFAATEDFGGEQGAALSERINRAASQLAVLMVAETGAVAGLSGERPQRRTGTDPNEDFLPFAQLLEGHDGTAG